MPKPRRIFRPLPAGRRITCNHCLRKTVKGTARVMRSVLFFFCRSCWNDRAACEAQMREAAK